MALLPVGVAETVTGLGPPKIIAAAVEVVGAAGTGMV